MRGSTSPTCTNTRVKHQPDTKKLSDLKLAWPRPASEKFFAAQTTATGSSDGTNGGHRPSSRASHQLMDPGRSVRVHLAVLTVLHLHQIRPSPVIPLYQRLRRTYSLRLKSKQRAGDKIQQATRAVTALCPQAPMACGFLQTSIALSMQVSFAKSTSTDNKGEPRGRRHQANVAGRIRQVWNSARGERKQAQVA